MQKIIPFLWFDKEAGKAVELFGQEFVLMSAGRVVPGRLPHPKAGRRAVEAARGGRASDTAGCRTATACPGRSSRPFWPR